MAELDELSKQGQLKSNSTKAKLVSFIWQMASHIDCPRNLSWNGTNGRQQVVKDIGRLLK